MYVDILFNVVHADCERVTDPQGAERAYTKPKENVGLTKWAFILRAHPFHLSLPRHRTPPSMAAALPHRLFLCGGRLPRIRRPLAARFASSSNTNSPVSFPFSDSDDDTTSAAAAVDPPKLPPPYDPFNKTPPFSQPPSDPSDLQQVFHNLRSGDGLMSSAVRMFDGLSKDGLTHEALALFSQIKDKGSMPDVVAHTAVIEAYAGAGRGKEALRTYLRMLSDGVKPNAYTYAVLIKGLARGGKVGEAGKYLVEMVGVGMMPNAGTIAALFEAFVKEGKVEEGGEVLRVLTDKGYVPDEKAVREQLGDKRGPVFRSVIGLLFGK